MIDLELAAIPNQTLTAKLAGGLFSITVKAVEGVMVADVTRDNVTVLQGSRIVAGTPIVPYKYLEAGNFVIITEDGDLPDYTKFGDSQFLIYATPSELSEVRGA